MSGQSDMDTVTAVNTTMKLDAESAGGAVLQLVQRRVDDVSTSWAAVQSLALLLQSPSASFHRQPGTVYSLQCTLYVVYNANNCKTNAAISKAKAK